MFAYANFPAANVSSMRKDPRKTKVIEYVRERLRKEVNAGPRGEQAKVAKALGIKAPHLSNIISTPPTRSPGEDLRRSAARMWGMTVEQLEAVALGKPLPTKVREADDDDYPARSLARQLAAEAGVPAGAIKLIDAAPYKRAEELTTADWLEEYLKARNFGNAVIVAEDDVTEEDREIGLRLALGLSRVHRRGLGGYREKSYPELTFSACHQC